MKFKAVIVVSAAAALTFAAMGSAAAQPLGPANAHRPASAPQVTGSRLQGALLPVSAFGNEMVFSSSLNTGSRLATTRARYRPTSLSCLNFEGKVYAGFMGDTAGAFTIFDNPSWRSSYPNTILVGYEDVLQFATTSAATTYYNQARTKYAACRSFTEPDFFAGRTGTISLLSVVNATESGHRAFVVNQQVTIDRFLQTPAFINVLYVLAGTNVYSTWNFSGTNDLAFPAQIRTVMHRVQALYPHH